MPCARGHEGSRFFSSCTRQSRNAVLSKASRTIDLKHFINHELLAPNVLTVPVDMEIVGEFADLARSEGMQPGYYSLAPWPGISDIRWISALSMAKFDLFQSAFDRLNIAQHVRQYLDIENDVRYYTGFLHIRQKCKESNMHVDWQLTNNEGFTIIIPIYGLENLPRLIYRKLTGEIAEYTYKYGEGILFGDHFIHSTPAEELDSPLALLVFNFGTDKMEHWDKLKRTQARQCPLVRLPNGEMIRVDPCAKTGPEVRATVLTNE